MMMLSKRGRPATGRSTKTVRVPVDMNMELAVTAYYKWLPILLEARDTLGTSPRYDKLSKLLADLSLPPSG